MHFGLAKLLRHIGAFLERRADYISQATERRGKNNESAHYDRISLRAGAACVLVLLAARVFVMLTPNADIAEEIWSKPSIFHAIEKADTYISNIEDPVNLKALPTTTKKAVFFKKKQPNNDETNTSEKTIWYEFKIDISDNEFAPYTMALLVPKIWGLARVYRDGKLFDFGKDIRPLIPISEKESLIQIRVDTSHSLKAGIRATYPPVWGKKELLQGLIEQINEQTTTYPRAESVQIIIAIIFSLFFLFSSKKPEVFAFLLYTIISLLYGILWKAIQRNDIILGWATLQFSALSILSVFRSLSLLLFVLEFTRKERAQIARWLVVGGLAVVGGAFCVSLIIRFYFGTALYNSYFPLQEIGFMLLSLLAFGDTFNLLRKEQRGKRLWRITWFLVIAAGIVFSQIMLIYDHFTPGLLLKEYIRNLVSFLLSATVVVAELTRKEAEHSRTLAALSRETQESLNKGFAAERHVHEGFLLLIDGIGFSRRARLCRNEIELDAYQVGVARHLARLLDTPETSLLNGTGDGFLVGFRLPLNSATASRITNLCALCTATSLDLSTLPLNEEFRFEKMNFRSALAYGKYTTGILKEGGLSKEVATASLFPPLERICKGDLPELHILKGDNKHHEISDFIQHDRWDQAELLDKEGVVRKYWIYRPA